MTQGALVFHGAKYIKADREAMPFSFYDPIPFFRKEIEITEPVVSATLLVQSQGFGKFYINGRDVTEDIFISAISDYDKILWYNTYDVTSLLKKGGNALCAIAGNGFLNESHKNAWSYDLAEWRDAPQILLCLIVNGRPVAVSDESWKVSKAHSHIIFSHLRSGEYVDMRKYDRSWLYSGYDDSDWQDALTRTKPLTATLRPIICQPVREHERIAPVSVTKASDGAYVVDFGVNTSGYCEIKVCEERGKEIALEHAEEIDSEGKAKHNNMGVPDFYYEAPFQLDKIIASGKLDTFKPLFTYHGFRYLRIEGLTDAPTADSVCAIFTHQDVERHSDFECGNEVLSFIYRAGIRSTYSNLFWCLTDCPTREKMGWTNDAQASMEQVLIDFDILPLLEKWFEDMKVSMFADGSLHGTIPAPDWEWGHKCGPVCDTILYEIPYRVYLYTGKTDMLRDGMPLFERYIGFLEKKLSEGHEFILGDWMGGKISEDPTFKRFVAEIFLLKAYDVTAFAHRVLNTGVTLWSEKAVALREEIARKYIDENGECNLALQPTVSMLLMMQIGEREALAKQLVSVVERDGCQLRSGMVGIQFIYHALSSIGRADLAFRLLTESVPGYRSWFEKGESTLWEIWGGENNGSHNHHMFSGVIAWFYRSLLGIAPKENAPAFEQIELAPCFLREVGFVKGYEDTVRGRIEAEWHYENGEFIYTVILPEGIDATYKGRKLTAGKNIFIEK